MKYIPWVFLASSLLLLVVGVSMFFRHILFFKSAIIVPATLVRYEERLKEDDEGTRTMYVPVYSYSFQGETREIASEISSGSSGHDIGKIGKVGIHPKTYEARVYSFWSTLLLSLGMIFGSILFFAFSAFVFNLDSSAPQQIAFMQNPQLFSTVFKLTLTVILLIPGGVGTWLLYSRITFFKNAVMVPGTVVRYNESTRYDEEENRSYTMYRQVVSYSFEGEPYEIMSSFSSNSISEPIGAIVKVGVNPKNPQKARIYSKVEYIIAIGLLGVGIICLLAIGGLFC